MIRATGTGLGISFDMRYGVVWNVAKYGEYRDTNGNVVRRENCGQNPELGKYKNYRKTKK